MVIGLEIVGAIVVPVVIVGALGLLGAVLNGLSSLRSGDDGTT